MPAEHARHREVDVVHRAEDLVVERVEADRDAGEAGVGERLRLLREQRAVRRQRHVDVAERGQRPTSSSQPAPEERLAARDPELVARRGPTKTRETRSISSKRQQLASRAGTR